MDPMLIIITIRRFFELLLTCVLVSAGLTCLNVQGVLATHDALCAGALVGVAVFVLVNIPMLRGCYFEFENNFLYFAVNLSAYACFFGAWFAVYRFGSNECFTWMFALTKVVRYSNLALSTLHSGLLFHAVGLLMILFAPIGMNWVFMQEDDGGLDVDEEPTEEETEEI